MVEPQSQPVSISVNLFPAQALPGRLRLRCHRTQQHANIAQVELARRLGKPQSFVSAYEAGARRVDLVEFLLIARTLGAEPVELFAAIARSVAGGGR
jgi:transcriptional regulator with XRE-family HTH domain